MIDLHCHILPGIDDGAADAGVALEMARMFVADGVTTVACTPHILPGLYHNSGPQIRAAVAALQQHLTENDVPLRLVTGSDAHVTPDFVQKLKSGHILSLADSRYVLVEPPHHVAPARLNELFFSILVAGYVPILTHPERLSWIESRYTTMTQLAASGIWMQITAGSFLGAFGSRPKYWAERLLHEGHVHVVATDSHDITRRRPELGRARELLSKMVGDAEAENLVLTRPRGVLNNDNPASLPPPVAGVGAGPATGQPGAAGPGASAAAGGLLGRLRRLIDG